MRAVLGVELDEERRVPLKSLFFRKEGSDAAFWRCGKCGSDCVGAGRFVQVANEVQAIVCDDCAPSVKSAIVQLVPLSFPDLDPSGRLLGGG